MAKCAITVVIPTLHEEKYIGLLLRDLEKQTLRADEVIVVDARSKDQTQKVVKKFKNVQLLTTRAGVGHQRTLGGKKATGALLYFLDADVRLSPNFIEKTSQLITAQKLECACPRYQPLTTSIFVELIFRFFNFLFWFGQKHFPSGAGPCIIVKKKVFTALGGFTAGLLVDDLDFFYRAGTQYKFAQLPYPVFVSDRRFRKYGVFHTLKQYLQISWLFVSKQLPQTNKLKYIFGKF